MLVLGPDKGFRVRGTRVKGRRQWLRQRTTDRDRKESHRLAHTHSQERELRLGTRARRRVQTRWVSTFTHTHTQANTLGFYTNTHIRKQWEGKETVAEAAHNGLGQEDKPQISD